MIRAPKADKRAAHNQLAKADELGAVTYARPTPERRRRNGDWEVEDKPGGLKTYRAPTPYDRAREGGHFSALEQDAARELLRDLEFSGSMRVIVSQVYDGMPHTQTLAGASLKSQAQWAAAERLDWVLNSMAWNFRALLSVLVAGVEYERKGQPWSLEELGARLSGFRGKDQSRAFVAGLMKGVLMRLAEAYAAWSVEYRRRQQAIEQRRAVEMAAKAEKAIVKVETEWQKEKALAERNKRIAVLEAYDRIVLGMRTPRRRPRHHEYHFVVTWQRRA
jgi:hypothetical protein